MALIIKVLTKIARSKYFSLLIKQRPPTFIFQNWWPPAFNMLRILYNADAILQRLYMLPTQMYCLNKANTFLDLNYQADIEMHSFP